MLTSTNPGTAADIAASTDLLILGTVVLVVSMLLVFGGLGLMMRGKPEVGFASIPFLVGAVLAIASLVIVTIGTFSEIEAEDDYRDSVQVWLSSVYDIEVSTDETALLIDGEDFVVDIDGDATAITLLGGAEDVLQVKVVGGEVLTPVN